MPSRDSARRSLPVLRCHNEIELNIKPSFFVILAFAVLFLPLKWLVAWFAAVAVHEISHYIALKFLDIQIYSVTVSAMGMQIHTAPTSLKREGVCALAGPIGGLLLLPFVRYIPVIATFALIHSLVNLIPIGERDGGRALRCMLQKAFGEERGDESYRRVEIGVKFISFCLLLIVAWRFQFYICLLLLISFLWFKGKTPCKPEPQIVQYRQ